MSRSALQLHLRHGAMSSAWPPRLSGDELIEPDPEQDSVDARDRTWPTGTLLHFACDQLPNDSIAQGTMGSMPRFSDDDTSAGSASFPAIVWPSRVLQPPRPPALIYLDLNHYIYLARVAAGEAVPDGYGNLLQAARTAHHHGRAVFPLSATHYVEMSGIRDPRQRAAIADVMQELSGFHVLLGRVTIAELEIDGMLDALLGAETRGEGIQLLSTGFGRAFGMRGGLVVRDADGNDSTSSMRDRMGESEFERFMAEANRTLERAMLAGPPDEELPALRAMGYAPEAAQQVTEQRAQQEREQAARLDAEDRWRRGRLRDVIGARELRNEWIDQITRAVLARGTSIGEVVREDRTVIRAFADGMPSSRVAITLKTRYHRNGQHQWTTNDIHDIDALAVAVPYCDIVFTDKAARNALAASSEIRPLGTFLPRRPRELADWIDNLPAPMSANPAN
jgi:hypothetical protein